MSKGLMNVFLMIVGTGVRGGCATGFGDGGQGQSGGRMFGRSRGDGGPSAEAPMAYVSISSATREPNTAGQGI